MRGTVVGFAFLAVLACGGSTTDPTAPGTVFFTIDQVTCAGTHPTYFEIDLTEVGPETLGPGATSQGYVVTGGRHATRARIMDYFGTPAALWTVNATTTVPPNGSITSLIVC